MKTVTINQLHEYEGKEVQLKGWVYNTRNIGKIWFLIFRDGTGLLQGVVVKGEATDDTFEMEPDLNQEDSVILTGIVRKEPRSVGGYELGIKEIDVVNHVTEEFPISPKEHGADFLMSNRHLWLRSKRQNAIMRVRHQIVKAIRDFFDDNGFILIDSPIFTGNAVEGTTTLFEVDYFERSAYLTQSGQLYQEAGAAAFGKTYCFGPAFRAEKSKTRRHLTEFWMVEPEMAFYDLDDDMDLAEEFIKYLFADVLENCTEDMEFFNQRIDKTTLETLQHIVDNQFERLTYADAIHRLEKSTETFTYSVEWGCALQAEHERYLSEKVFKKPIIVYNYPEKIKSFYMKLNEDGETVRAMDVLIPKLGEIIGGSQREENYDILLKRLKDSGLSPEEYWWYLDLRRFGSAPHSGFGLGFERLVQFVTGMENIRDVIPFPRTPKHARF